MFKEKQEEVSQSTIKVKQVKVAIEANYNMLKVSN